MLISGKELSQEIKDRVKKDVEDIVEKGYRAPQLVVILVGEDPASKVYVRNKVRACEYTGMTSQMIKLDESTSEEELLKLIDELNKDNDVDGILVQLPLPKHIHEESVIHAIDSSKDVDGFHPDNVAKLFIGQKSLEPCTPKGMMYMLDSINCDLTGKEVVVVGRSNIVGKPVSMMALHRNATVTIAHSRTKDLKKVCQRADVLITSIGQPHFFDSSYIKEGAVVIDVGINRTEDNKLVGDCNYKEMMDKAYAITPVPGGVGPMTIAMLMSNTLEAYKERNHGIWNA